MGPQRTRIVELRLRSTEPNASSEFVRLLLPQLDSPPSWPGLARLTFGQGSPLTGGESNMLPSFWKLSVFTDNIAGLTDSLRSAGTAVTDPVQFGDIGYLCHLQEPGSNSIELIQRTFRDSAVLATESPDTLGLITLRVSDPQASTKFYVDGLGMQLLATMAVDDGRPDPFDLYFFGYSDTPPPDSDPASVKNREWLYQRTSTLIELQHYRPPTPELQAPGEGAPSLEYVLLEAEDPERLEQQIIACGVVVKRESGALAFVSPDGHQFRVT